MGDAATIYSPRPDEPTEAALQAAAAGADLSLVRRASGALRIEVAWPDLRVTCDAAADPERAAQITRLRAYAREMSTAARDPLPARIAATRLVLSLKVDPGFDAEGRAEALLSALARHHAGLVLRDGRVRDAAGACLVAPTAPVQAPDAPGALRVARRALVLGAVVCRASIEQAAAEAAARSRAGRAAADELERARELQERLLAWLDVYDLGAELEPAERAFLAAPPGVVPRQQAIDASWRSEGLAALGWALHLSPLPPHDRQADPRDVAVALGFLDDEPPRALDDPWLREADELQREARLLAAVRWRLRAFALRPEPMDLRRTAAAEARELARQPLVDGDLALRGRPLARCDARVVRECAQVVRERALALRWVTGAHEVYSEVDRST